MLNRYGRVLAGCVAAWIAAGAVHAQSPALIDGRSAVISPRPSLPLPAPPSDEATSPRSILTSAETDGPEFELAERLRSKNYDPLVDHATPNDVGTGPHAPDAAVADPESPWLHLGLYGNAFYWMYGGPSYFTPVPPPPRPAWAKDGMWQRLTTTATWLLPGGDDSMGVWDLEFKPLLGVPIPSMTWPTLLTPGFGIHMFDGPTTSDVPSTVYDLYLDIRWMKQLTPGVGIELGLTPGWYSDFQQSDGDAFRMGARAVGAFTCTPEIQAVAGLAFLDRFDVSILPVGGVIWMPSPDRRYELLIPRPKAAWRLDEGCEFGRWVYIAGEFGGGMWAIERANGREDQMVYRDYRLVLGLERTTCDGLYTRIEAGYVFGRKIEYNSGRENELDPTLMVRGEVAF
jgi:hypothetical protein